MANGAALQAGLDEVFSFFAAGQALQRGQYDRDVRHPEIFAAIAAELGVLPAPARTALLTGSKGKGSCARLLAAYLGGAGRRVGLIVTPEELHHLDRIRIDGVPIGAADFLKYLARLRPLLAAHARSAPARYYHPPTAIFLLIGLLHFQANGVDYVVIEGGRGAAHDEIGQLSAAVGIVTCILPEHLSRLGPTMAELCADKFSLNTHCAALLCSEQAFACARACALPLALLHMVEVVEVVQAAPAAGRERPAWLALSHALALAALARFGLAAPAQLPGAAAAASCQRLDAALAPVLAPGELVFLDGAVSADCLDLDYMQSACCRPAAIVTGMTADKDVAGLLAVLTAHGFTTQYHFAPTSACGHVAPPAALAWSGRFDTAGGLDAVSGAALLALLRRHRRVYLIGVQVFLRSVRNFLGVERLAGDAGAER